MGTSHKQVVVIGAGIAGLVCAYRLKSLGADVLLVETSGRVGGVMQTEAVDGYLIERGPNSSQGTEELMALVEELGLTGELLEGDPKAPAYVYFGGRLHPVPAGAGAFIKSKLLSTAGKLRILREPFIGRRAAGDEESILSFARRRIGREAAERMVAPFVSGIYAGDAEKISVQAAFPRLWNLELTYGGLIRGTIAKAREARRAKRAASAVLDKAAPTRRRLISFKRGMAALPQRLAAKLGEDLMTGVAGCELRMADSAAALVTFSRSGVTHQATADHVIVATPAKAAASILKPISSELSELLAGVYYPPLAILYLAYDAASVRTPLDGFGFLVAPSEGMNILGCVWNSSLFAGRAPQGKALLTTFVGGARRPEAARLPDAELVAAAHGELQAVLGITGEPTVVGITRWERAIPQYNIGHRDRVTRIEALLKQTPGLHLAGNYLHGVSTGDVIKEADRVARDVHQALAEAR
ncbi:MAG TPA: protoporphyrinogen oxidase [Blastocatellia bacterium]|nr:protoporphyrinogen oxidase [Blastocatellia bacterium]